MFRRALAGALVVLAVVAVGYFTRAGWLPNARAQLLHWLGAPAEVAKGAKAADEHGHDHADHAGHEEANSLELSKQAQANIGLKTAKVELSTFTRSITIPGIIVERPSRSTQTITAPLTGIVTKIFPSQGEAVRPGDKLFVLQLTHEELVQGQGDFLRVAEELDVIENEIRRLEKLAVDGGIPGRQVLERQYERQNKQAVLRAQHQALLLHGLSEEQIKGILETRTLLRELTVFVPDDLGGSELEDKQNSSKSINEEPVPLTPGSSPARGEGRIPKGSRQTSDERYEIRELRVTRGQSVAAGETLAVLTDHHELLIEGNAFDKDIRGVNRAVEADAPVTAVLETDEPTPEKLEGLKILYVAGTVDPASRTFHFYLALPNTLVRDVAGPDDRHFISWRFKPGQRVQLNVPTEQWQDRIVLPVEAVAQDGVETYVFSPNGDHFDRRPVHVEYRDRFSVVIANDGSLFPGDIVATNGAQQMQLALKNKAGGGIDPHAGHNH